MTTTKPWWTSKTLWVNAAFAALLAIEAKLALLQPLLPVNFYALVATVLPAVNAVLRIVTTHALVLRVRTDA